MKDGIGNSRIDGGIHFLCRGHSETVQAVSQQKIECLSFDIIWSYAFKGLDNDVCNGQQSQ